MADENGVNPGKAVAVDEAGAPIIKKRNPLRARHEMFNLKKGILTDPFNVDQLFKPIDFSDLDPSVDEYKARTGRATDDGQSGGAEDTAKYGPMRGFYRQAHNVALWTANQAGKSGVGPLVKGREIFDAGYTVQQHYRTQAELTPGGAADGLASFGQPIYFLGQQISELTEAARPITYMFEGKSNASLDNAKDPKLGYLNLNSDTWGPYSAAMMGLQDYKLVNALLNHPFARRAVQRVQRENNINADFHKNLLDELRRQLTNEADKFDRRGQFVESETQQWMKWGLGYTTPNVADAVASDAQSTALMVPGDEAPAMPTENQRKNQSLFDRVQAHQKGLFDLHQQGHNVYPDLRADFLNESPSPEQEYEVQKYVIENLFLLTARAEELMDAQGVLGVLDGVAGDEQDNQRQLKKLLSGLGYGSMPLSQGIAKLRLLASEDPAVREKEIRRKKFLTLNTRAMFETNGFLRAAALALVHDQDIRTELFSDRSPQVRSAFAALEAQNPYFFRQKANAKLRYREFARWVDAQFLANPAHSWVNLSAEEQGTHPLLPALARHDLGTVNGRTRFVRDAAQYLQQVRMDDAANRQYPVSASELLSQLQTSAHVDFGGEYIELANGIDLNPQDKRLLATQFQEMGVKFGASGRALQQVLAMYSLLHHGLNLGRGSFTEVLSPEAVRGYSEFRDRYHEALQAEADKMQPATSRPDEQVSPALNAQLQALARFTDEFQAYYPLSTKEWKRAKPMEQGEEEAYDSMPDEVQAQQGPRPRKSTLYMPADELPERLSVEELRAGTTGLTKRTEAELPRYIHLPNKQAGTQLYRRDERGGKPVWQRQYPTAHARLNRYGEYAYSASPVFANEQDLAGAALRVSPDYVAFQAKARAYAVRNGLLRTDAETKEQSYEISLTGNQTLVVTEKVECSTGVSLS